MNRDLQRDIDRAGHAERLLQDDLLKEAVEAIRKEVFQAWIDCPARDKEGKEALWQLAKTTDKFEQLLRGYIESGKLAQANLRTFEKSRGFLEKIIG